MAATLASLLDSTRRRVAEERRSTDPLQQRQRAAAHVPRGFARALRGRAPERAAVVAELKKASPSKGELRGTFPVARLAAELEQAGAAALSVLTEPEFFHGSLANLVEASAATRLPCLRKDFIVDEFQIEQARANRADAILLIVAALNNQELANLMLRAEEQSLDVLCEVHDEPELERALAVGCKIIGVNSRNLKTFEVDHGNLLRLAPKLPKDALRVAESGIRNANEIRELASAGYEAFLIGETLMRAESPGEKLQELLAG